MWLVLFIRFAFGFLRAYAITIEVIICYAFVTWAAIHIVGLGNILVMWNRNITSRKQGGRTEHPSKLLHHICYLLG